MSLGSRITALLTSLTRNQLAAMAPAQRQALANECQRVLSLAAAADAKPAPRSGVLAHLKDGERSQ